MSAQTQVLLLPGAQNSKISVRFSNSGELGRLLRSSISSDGNVPTLAAAGFPRQ
tara:strand:+ start:1900 stop:2061 length:162 start_codon:yes stop_codon:yes gene_type:complete